MTCSLSSSCFLFFAGICGCRQSHSNTHTRTHTHTHHPAGLRLNLQDSRSAETHTTSCSEDQRSQTEVRATLHHSKLSGETSEYFLLTHLNLNSFTFISVHLTRRTCWFRGPFVHRVLISSLIDVDVPLILHFLVGPPRPPRSPLAPPPHNV